MLLLFDAIYGHVIKRQFLKVSEIALLLLSFGKCDQIVRFQRKTKRQCVKTLFFICNFIKYVPCCS